MRRYAAWHISEPGFETEAAAQRWIKSQRDYEEWVVVATDDDYVPTVEAEGLFEARRRTEMQDRISAAVRAEHQRLIRLLGLDI